MADDYEQMAARLGAPVEVKPFSPADLAARAARIAAGEAAPDRAEAAPEDPGVTDDTTLAIIEISDAATGDAFTIPNVSAFSYSSDVLMVGDPFSVTVPDPRREWLGRIKRGQTITFYMVSRAVAGGARTRKNRGVIVEREVTCNAQGTVLQLHCADLGWHLVHNDGPLWFGLHGASFQRLLDAAIAPQTVFKGSSDPRWGLRSIVTEYDTTRRLKHGKQGIVLAQQAHPITPLARIQIEPGEKLFDLISLYAKREHLLVKVTPDGDVAVFTPNYTQDPLYAFYCYPPDEPGPKPNNVRADGIRLHESIEEVWTEVICVGDIPLPDLIDEHVAQDDVNANKFRGVYRNPSALPFEHRLVFHDGEALSRGFADERAFWKAKMGLFNAHVVTFTARGHQQGGAWFESDTMCWLDLPVIGVKGRYYVASVRCDRDEDGDRTQFTCHLPDLLAA